MGQLNFKSLDVMRLDTLMNRVPYDFNFPGLRACAFHAHDEDAVNIVIGNRRWKMDRWAMEINNGKGFLPWIYDIGESVRSEIATVKEDRDY